MDHLENGGSAEGVFLPVGIQRLLLEDAGLDGGIITDARLADADQGVLHIHADLIDSLLQRQFRLPRPSALVT